MENYVIANCTDTGRVRKVNEDSMATFDSPNGRVVVVCDGMGGQNAGDVASQLAVAVIEDILTDNRFDTPEEAITRSVVAANQAILHRASQDANLAGMGATCVILIIKEGMVFFGSVGDSRIYYLCNGMIRQITKDQSYVQTLVDAGEISAEDAEHHKDKNQITNALGIEGMAPPTIGAPIKPEPGSVFLLCSDGLSGMISNSSILQTVSDKSMGLQERARMLVNRANEAGGLDNITVQLVEFPATSGAGAGAPATYGNESPAAVVNKNKTIVYAVVAALIVLLGGGGLAYWLLNKPEKNAEVKVKQTETVRQQNETPTTEKVTEKVIIVETEAPAPVSSKSKSDKGKKNSSKQKIEKKNSGGSDKDLKDKVGGKKDSEEPTKEPEKSKEMKTIEKPLDK